MAKTKEITGPLVGISGIGAVLGKSDTWGTTWAAKEGFCPPTLAIETLLRGTGGVRWTYYWDVEALRAWYAKIGGSTDRAVKNPRGFAGVKDRETRPTPTAKVELPEPVKRPRKAAEPKPKVEAEKVARPKAEPKSGGKPRLTRAQIRERKAAKEAAAATAAA